MPKKIIERARRFFRRTTKTIIVSGEVTSRDKHTISRSAMSPHAVRVMHRLKEAGYSAYMVGGGVRDILLNRKPKDFDVVTNAHPEKIRNLFRNSRIIGRRFRLVHVFFDDEVIEVSTFRANTSEQVGKQTEVNAKTGMIAFDNTYGTIEEDAWRRDFTVNALYYNIADFSVIDFTTGMQDLQHRVIRMIGDPTQRFHEDPVRLLRAIRLSAKLNFTIEPHTEDAVKALSPLLQHVPASRLFDECLKLFFEGNAWITYQKLMHYHYMNVLFPQTIEALTQTDNQHYKNMIQTALQATDHRWQTGESVNPGFLFSVFLWPTLQIHLSAMKNKKVKFFMRLHQIITSVIETQIKTMMIPKRLQFTMQAIWVLQFQLMRRRPARIFAIFQHRYFRAAYDFMAFRVEVGEISPEVFNWWKEFQTVDADAQQKMIEQLH